MVSNTATGCKIVVSGKELFVVVWLTIVRWFFRVKLLGFCFLIMLCMQNGVNE